MIVDRRKAPSAPKKTIWIYSVVASLFAIGIMVFGWSRFGFQEHPSIHKLNSPDSVADVLSASATIEFESGELIWRLPTGLFIESFAFITPTDVNLTGYIWQKYPANYPSDFERGIIFPEEVNSGSTVIREAYRTHGTQSGTSYETIGWYFDVTVRQSFDYSNYPLDAITLWLRIWPKDWDNDDKIVLVPDFDSYAQPIDRVFGLDAEVVKGSGKWQRPILVTSPFPMIPILAMMPKFQRIRSISS